MYKIPKGSVVTAIHKNGESTTIITTRDWYFEIEDTIIRAGIWTIRLPDEEFPYITSNVFDVKIEKVNG